VLKYICKYKDFLKESVSFKDHFVIRDPETGDLYSVEVPDGKEDEIVRMERASEKFLRVLSDLKDSAKLNAKRIAAHGNDNKVASDLFVKWLTGKEITPSEYEFIKKTAIGNLKLVGIGSAELFLPGSSVTLPMILVAAGKNNVNLFPDAWNRIKKEKKKYKLNKDKSLSKKLKLVQRVDRYSGSHKVEKTKHQVKLENKIKKLERALKR
jgi:hypothetical protein